MNTDNIPLWGPAETKHTLHAENVFDLIIEQFVNSFRNGINIFNKRWFDCLQIQILNPNAFRGCVCYSIT